MTGYNTVRLDEIKSGMILARDVCDAGGALLLSSGTVLDHAATTTLLSCGVSRVLVVDSAPTCVSTKLSDNEQRLAILFRNVGDEPLLRKLREVVHEYRMQKRQ